MVVVRCQKLTAQLPQGDVESLDDTKAESTAEYQNFDDFAQRTTPDQRPQLFGRSLHPDRIPTSQMEPNYNRRSHKLNPMNGMM